LFFGGKSDMLKLATGIASYSRIYEELKNAKQQAVVGAPENRKVREVIAEIPAPADYLTPDPDAWRVRAILRDATGRDRAKVAPAPG